MRIFIWFAIVVAAPSNAFAECPETSISEGVMKGVSDWQDGSKVFIHFDVVDALSMDACEAVERLATSGEFLRTDLKAKIPEVTSDLLSQNLDSDEVLPFSAMLLEAISPGGFSFPAPTPWPTLKLIYNIEPDMVELDGVSTVSPIFTYNIPIGTIELRATRVGSSDCVHSVVSELGGNYSVKCEF